MFVCVCVARAGDDFYACFLPLSVSVCLLSMCLSDQCDILRENASDHYYNCSSADLGQSDLSLMNCEVVSVCTFDKNAGGDDHPLLEPPLLRPAPQMRRGGV